MASKYTQFVYWLLNNIHQNGWKSSMLFYFYNSEKEWGENQLAPSMKTLPSISKLMNTNLKMHGLKSPWHWVGTCYLLKHSFKTQILINNRWGNPTSLYDLKASYTVLLTVRQFLFSVFQWAKGWKRRESRRPGNCRQCRLGWLAVFVLRECLLGVIIPLLVLGVNDDSHWYQSLSWF